MNTVERIKAECKRRKIPISHLEKELGFANGYIRNLREGNMPAHRLEKVAEFLGVSYYYLLTGAEKRPQTPILSSEPGQTMIDMKISREDEILLRAYHSADETTRRNIRLILQIPDEPQGNSTALLSS